MKYDPNVIQSRYKLVPRTLIFIENGHKLLLIKKVKGNSFGVDKHNGIGGHIEKGEEPYESARREIFEETGLIINDLDLFAMIFIEIGIDPGILLFVFRAKYPGGDLIASDEGELVWIDKKLIESLDDIVKDIPFLLKLSKDHDSGAQPIIGKYLYNKNGEMRIVINAF